MPRLGRPVPVPPTATVARSAFGMAATGSPEATAAAVEILEDGGNAIDAAVAAALTLGASDPDASGIGGVTFMVIHLADGSTIAIDGAAPTPLYLDTRRLQELKDGDALWGHEVVAVPTTLAVLERARASYGSMTLATLLAPAIRVAESGHRVNPTQIVWTNVYYDQVVSSESLRFIAFSDGETLGAPGEVVTNPDLARTLRHIAQYGVASFYQGAIANLIEGDMIRGGGFLRKADLASLRVRPTQPLHTTYRGADVFTVPPPGGGTPVLEALNILETFPSDFLAGDTVERHHVFIEAFRIALADRWLVPERVASSQRRSVPALSKEHAARRAAQIVPDAVIPKAELYGHADPECAPSGESTTQVSVADRWGNVVSLTQTLGRSWGAKVVTPGLGFPLNSLLETFNFDKPQCPGYLQPRIPCATDMAPTILLSESGSLVAALGSPGSDLIPSIIVSVVSNLIDRGADLEDAVIAPRVLFGGLDMKIPYIEVKEPITEADIDALEAMGHDNIDRYYYPPVSRRIVLYGGVNAVGWDGGTASFVGVGDGRRWGSAQGPESVAQTPEGP